MKTVESGSLKLASMLLFALGFSKFLGGVFNINFYGFNEFPSAMMVDVLLEGPLGFFLMLTAWYLLHKKHWAYVSATALALLLSAWLGYLYYSFQSVDYFTSSIVLFALLLLAGGRDEFQKGSHLM